MIVSFQSHRTKGKVILILNGHLSHTNLAVVDLCESFEIQLVLLPLHTSHVLQSLDVSFFKPLKTYYHNQYQQATAWQHINTSKAISKVDFGLLKQAWNLSVTVGNAVKGFEKTGIYPLNPNATPTHKFVGDNIIDASQNHLVEMSSTNGDAQSSSAITEITNTIKELLPLPEKRTTTKKTNTASTLHLTSPENKAQLLQKMQKSRKRNYKKTLH